MLSDGEFQEGSTWEAMMMAANLKLDNLIAFMDNNDFSGLERMSEGHPAFYPLCREGRGVRLGSGRGRRPRRARRSSTRSTQRRAASRCCWSCRTVKGKGVSYMEHVPIWHYRSPNKDEYQQALGELAESGA